MTAKIIAEIGINHNGRLSIAMDLVKAAHDAGAWAVKFQKRDPKIVYRDIWDEPRNDGNPYGWTTQGQQKKGIELGQRQYDQIHKLCDDLGITWFASTWDYKSVQFIDQYALKYHKIASAMVTNGAYLESLLNMTNKPQVVFVSTGGCRFWDVQNVVKALEGNAIQVIIMHCVPVYPCPDDQCKIAVIEELRELWPGNSIGYSGHEAGLPPSIAAAARGAEYIERHITLDRSAYGSDQAASLEISGLRRLVEYCEAIDRAVGQDSNSFKPTEQDMQVIHKLRYWEV